MLTPVLCATTCMAYARAIGVNATEEAACLNDRVGCDGWGYFELADNHNFGWIRRAR